MKHFSRYTWVLLFFPFAVMSQTKMQEKKESVIVITPKTEDSMILYVINNKYYLGDTINILIPRLDVSKIKRIEQVKDSQTKSNYSKKTGKFAKKVKDIFVVETTEDFEYKIKDRK